jgi:hypothetical protein
VDGDPNNLALDATRVPPKLATSAKKNPAPFAVGALAIIAMGGMLFWFNPAQYRFYPFCLFHKLTGLLCPGCGGTRALYHLLHGHVMVALHLNALLVISLPLLTWLGVRFAMGEISPPLTTHPISPKWLWFSLALAVVFAILRNLPAFAWLAP